MATQLVVCTKEEQRSVIRFLWAEGVPPSEIHRRIVAQYGENCLAQRKVYEWVEKFKHGRTSVVDEPRTGRPNTATTEDNIAKVDAAVHASKRVSIPELVAEVGVSAGSIHAILHNHLNYQKVCARWVPKQLMDVHKRQRVEMSGSVLHHAGPSLAAGTTLGWAVPMPQYMDPNLAPENPMLQLGWDSDGWVPTSHRIPNTHPHHATAPHTFPPPTTTP
uniref:Mos1 transposase HTH domain-containing protein n=1 Tax=Crocodylus porosus TaxID=8502 RepID=A0A7M4EMQ5_CROPO